jgi:parallel beta-helix repeat protein
MLKRRLTLTLTVLVVALLLASYPAVPAEADHTTNRIQSCRTIDQSGSYVLDRNIQARGDCLVIATSNVTIDLAGYTITGDGTGYGIRTPDNPATAFDSHDAITVRNGTVTNFGVWGIQLPGRHQLVEQVRVTNNQRGILIFAFAQPAGNTIRNSIASGNGFSGIVLAGTGNSIIGNVANANAGDGIQTGCPSTILNNVATGNSFDIVATGTCTRLGNSPLP